ncbi:MAG: 6,7-dimethyl-8-ribityllumazine synthase [Candidatus Xenobia bacterium]
MRLAIISSHFNREVTEGLLAGALDALKEHSLTVADTDIFHVPGAFEIPLAAQTLAETGRYDGVICLGAVIKGDTAHFEYISEAAVHGIMEAGLRTRVPLALGVLTTYTDEQAVVRSTPGPENKGREAALACLEQIRVLAAITGKKKAAETAAG